MLIGNAHPLILWLLIFRCDMHVPKQSCALIGSMFGNTAHMRFILKAGDTGLKHRAGAKATGLGFLCHAPDPKLEFARNVVLSVMWIS